MPRRTLLCGALLCLLSTWGCMVIPPSQDPDPEPPADCFEGASFVCDDPRGCIRIDRDGSFENDFSGHWGGDLDDGDENETSARRVPSVTAIVDHDNDDETEPVAMTVRPCHSQKMLSFGTRERTGLARFVTQEIDVSQYTTHISDRSRVVVQAAFNVMPGNLFFGTFLDDRSGFGIGIDAFRNGNSLLGPGVLFRVPVGGPGESDRMQEDPSVWLADWVETSLQSGVDTVKVTMGGVPEPRSVDHLFVDDVRIWLVLNAPDADLELTMQADRNSAFIGQQVSFTLTVTNRGTETAEGVRIIDVLPGQLRYESQSGDGIYNPLTGVWDVGDLLAGSSASLTITATVTSLEQVTIVNSAGINDGLLGDFNADNDGANLPLHLNQAAPPPEPPPGVIVFSDSIFNAADWSVMNADLTDTLQASFPRGAPPDAQAARLEQGGSTLDPAAMDESFRQTVTPVYSSDVVVRHLHQGATVDPADGEIALIEAQMDVIVFDALSPGRRFSVAPVMVQGDRVWSLAGSNVALDQPGVWQTLSMGAFGGCFNCGIDLRSGGPITFGFQSPTDGLGPVRYGVDNWKVTVHRK